MVSSSGSGDVALAVPVPVATSGVSVEFLLLELRSSSCEQAASVVANRMIERGLREGIRYPHLFTPFKGRHRNFFRFVEQHAKRQIKLNNISYLGCYSHGVF